MLTLPAAGTGDVHGLVATLRGLDRPERAAQRAHYIAEVFAQRRWPLSDGSRLPAGYTLRDGRVVAG